MFILSDDQGEWAMGCSGNQEIITPNLDRMAKEGIRFKNFFCASPVCSPARASILTGAIPSRHGVLDWLCAGNLDTEKYPDIEEKRGKKEKDHSIMYLEGQETYIQYLAEAGYHCMHSGKWHLGASDHVPEGYAQWFALDGGGCPYYQPDFYENGRVVCEDRYVTDVITDKAIQYLEERAGKEQPFYLGVHYTAPHSPWTEENHPREYLEMYQDCPFESVPDMPIHCRQRENHIIPKTEKERREYLTGYYASITAMDANIGRLIDALERIGKIEDTIIIFTSDNGNNMGHHGIWGKGNGTYPQNMYDSSVKVPFLMWNASWNDRHLHVNENLYSHYDLFLTILDIAEIPYPYKAHRIGHSFWDDVKQDRLRETENEIVVCSEYASVRMLRTNRYKLILDYLTGEDYFYDLINDPQEEHNQIYEENYAVVINAMKKKLEQWFQFYGTEKNDGRKYFITGTGQRDLCDQTGAFRTVLEMYWDKEVEKGKYESFNKQ